MSDDRFATELPCEPLVRDMKNMHSDDLMDTSEEALLVAGHHGQQPPCIRIPSLRSISVAILVALSVIMVVGSSRSGAFAKLGFLQRSRSAPLIAHMHPSSMDTLQADDDNQSVEEIIEMNASTRMNAWDERVNSDPYLWKVVNEVVLVRAKPLLSAKVLHIYHKGDFVLGKKIDGFLALIDRPGYIKIVIRNKILVSPRSVSFERVSQHTCTGNFTEVYDELHCHAASVFLHMPLGAVQFDTLQGCEMRGINVTRSHICCSKDCPPWRASQDVATTTVPTSTSSLPSTVVNASTTATTSTSSEPAVVTTPVDSDPSLFCFAVIRTMSFEAELMRNAYPHSLGIFGCNAWAVYSDIATWLVDPGKNETIGIPGPAATYNRLWLNSGVFIRAWTRLLKDGVFRMHKWTIKADPDAVFLPERMRQHLRQSNYGWDPVAYFKNCEQFHSMQGPLEVYSRGAVARLATDLWSCTYSIDQSHIGEDGFMDKCMERLGIQPINDFSLLQDMYCGKTYYGQPIPPCYDNWKVAFHPMKSVAKYFQCLSETGVHVADEKVKEADSNKY